MSLDGKVAWITAGGDEIGRAVALALSARGVAVVVTGPVERSLGVVVGEVAHGGGKARHLVADPRDPAEGAAAVARALDAFGRLDMVIACPLDPPADPRGHVEAALGAALMGASCAFEAAHPSLQDGGRLVAVGAASTPEGAPGHAAVSASRAGLAGLVAAMGLAVAPRAITCNALLPLGEATAGENGEGRASGSAGGAPAEPEDVAQLVVFLCGNAGAPLTGQALAVTGVPAARARRR